MRRHSLPRITWLKKQGLIQALFDRERTDITTTAAGCIRIMARPVSPEEMPVPVPVQVGFAPGRKARRAVDRNRVKRIMREVYRRHQHELNDLFTPRPDALTLMILFRGDVSSASVCIPRDLPRALRRLLAHYGS